MINFELSIEEANTVLNALMELPAKTSMGIIQKMQTQAAEQLNAEPEEEEYEGGE